MTLNEYLNKNLSQIVMITLSTDQQDTCQYNYWNWFPQINQLHLLKNDFSLGHILHDGTISINEDGSLAYKSKYLPKECMINCYFGGSLP